MGNPVADVGQEQIWEKNLCESPSPFRFDSLGLFMSFSFVERKLLLRRDL